MAEAVYQLAELTGTSQESIEKAVESAVAFGEKTIHNLRWFQVTETRGAIKEGKVVEWQVTVKVGARAE